MNASTTLVAPDIREAARRSGFFSRLIATILLSRERSAMSQIARFDPAMADQIRQARTKSFAKRAPR